MCFRNTQCFTVVHGVKLAVVFTWQAFRSKVVGTKIPFLHGGVSSAFLGVLSFFDSMTLQFYTKKEQNNIPCLTNLDFRFPCKFRTWDEVSFSSARKSHQRAQIKAHAWSDTKIASFRSRTYRFWCGSRKHRETFWRCILVKLLCYKSQLELLGVFFSKKCAPKCQLEIVLVAAPVSSMLKLLKTWISTFWKCQTILASIFEVQRLLSPSLQ